MGTNGTFISIVHSQIQICFHHLSINQYIIANLGFSLNFGGNDMDHITFPATMSIDWICIYQPKNAINIGCDPKDFPTATYIHTSVAFLFRSLHSVAFCWAEAEFDDLEGLWPAHTAESSATIWNTWIIDNLIGFLAFTIDFSLLSAYKLSQPVIPNFTNRVSSVGIYFNLSIVKILPTVRYPIIFEHHPVFPLQILTSYTGLYWIPEAKKQSVFEQISIFGWSSNISIITWSDIQLYLMICLFPAYKFRLNIPNFLMRYLHICL